MFSRKFFFILLFSDAQQSCHSFVVAKRRSAERVLPLRDCILATRWAMKWCKVPNQIIKELHFKKKKNSRKKKINCLLDPKLTSSLLSHPFPSHLFRCHARCDCLSFFFESHDSHTRTGHLLRLLWFIGKTIISVVCCPWSEKFERNRREQTWRLCVCIAAENIRVRSQLEKSGNDGILTLMMTSKLQSCVVRQRCQ